MEDLKPSDILTLPAFKNAIAVCMAIGGSTNAIIHLTAIAGRLNISLYPEIFNELGSWFHVLRMCNHPEKRLIDEFDKAGGIPAVMTRLGNLIDLDAKTYTGEKLEIAFIKKLVTDDSMIKTIAAPVTSAPTIAILSAETLHLMVRSLKLRCSIKTFIATYGPAFVFENYEEMLNRIDDETLPVDASSVLVLRNAGPKAVPGMPEWGMIPIPKKLAQTRHKRYGAHQ